MEENIIKRVPPHSDEAEKSVLGAMLMSHDAIVTATESITAEDFYQRQYGVIFEAMKELYDADIAVDVVTLNDKLKEKELSPDLTGMDYIKEIIESVPTSANVKYYADIVSRKALLRRLIKASRGIEDDCFMEVKSTDEIMDETEKSIFNVLQDKRDDNFMPIR